jgi:N-acetylmuramic acid 6-phosphate etherase
VDPGLVRGLIAGGLPALTSSIEDAEDKAEEGVKELKEIDFSAGDVLVGITASGGAPYVLGALAYAREIGAVTGAISCNEKSETFALAKHQILLNVGPEVVTGSTRMKSGTAQKLALNMISTAAMIRIGKVYNNYMVDLRPVNKKLILRSIRLIMEISGADRPAAEEAFYASGKRPKTAIVMLLAGTDPGGAEELLKKAEGHISRIPVISGKG